MSRAWGLATAAILALLPDNAHAEPPAKSGAYGWQTLAVDGAALVTMGFAVQPSLGWHGLARPSALTLTAEGIFLLGPPLVHALHERPAAAAISVLGRAAAIGLWALTVRASERGFDGIGDTLGLGMASVGACATMIVIDASLLSRESILR